MELVFLGTGAAEGVPAAYCRCAACEGVRRRGGVEVKTRSSLRVGAHHQIDIAPDNYAQMIRAGTDMYDVEHLLVTHSHGDHFDFNALKDKGMSRATNGKIMTIYMSEAAKKYVEDVIRGLRLGEEEMRWIGEHFTVQGLEHFREYRIGGLSVETVKGNHTAHGEGEYSINYLIRLPQGKTLLYACDTGFYTEETWEYLKGRHADVLVHECTFAGRTDRSEFPGGHHDLRSFRKSLDRMAQQGFIDERTPVYATHFNPHQGLDHHQIQERLEQMPYRATAAFDGLRVIV